MSFKKYLEPVIHSLIWIVGYLVFVLAVKTLGIFTVGEQTLLVPVTIGTIINIALFYISALYLIPYYSFRKNNWSLFGMLIGLFAGLTLIETAIDYLFFINFYSEAEIDQQFSVQLFINTLFNLFVFSVALTYGFIRMYFINEKQRQQLKQEKLEAELQFLKAQVNPHFLFNVLNMAFASATSNGDEKTAEIIEKLANLMRYMLYESNVDKIELQKEIDYLESFVHLQKNRLSSEVLPSIEFQMNGNFTGSKIAPLLLVPFVENAFKHGIRMGKPSYISIILSVEEERLFFRVKNSRANIKTDKSSSVGGIGLKNVQKRLDLLYANNHVLEIVENDEDHIITLTLNLN